MNSIASAKYKGFSLIEALVALVILAISIGVLTTWLNTAQGASQRVNENLLVESVLEQSIGVLDAISFESTRSGEFYIQDLRVVWDANPIKNSHDEPFIRQPEWMVMLFSVDLVFYIDNRRITKVNTKLVKQWSLDKNATL